MSAIRLPGGIVIDPPLALAPMAGVTDAPFRRLCRQFGAGLVVSEMLGSQPQLRDSRKSRLRRITTGDPEPRAVQLLGNDPAQLADAARRAVNEGAQIIDLNFGCPAKKVCRRAAGSALLAEPDTIARLLDAVLGAVTVPVTLKMRTGVSREARNAVEVARMAEQCGVAMLSIHGRTRADRYAGEAEYDTIARVVEAVSLPVFANGDIDSPQKARRVLAQTGAAGVMIGRAAFGQPWLFASLGRALFDLPAPEVPDRPAQIEIFRDHLAQVHDHYGPETGLCMARKHARWYASTLDLDADWLPAFQGLQSPADQLAWISRIDPG
ncbi:MAG: tRNA dihydrouridine synthase DusB [Halothiobacillaceae bacterium]